MKQLTGGFKTFDIPRSSEKVAPDDNKKNTEGCRGQEDPGVNDASDQHNGKNVQCALKHYS